MSMFVWKEIIMEYTYRTSKTCSTEIKFEIQDNKLKNIRFIGGCNGNLKGIAALVEGMDCEEVVKRLSGITCGFKSTSCPDQLSKAVQEAISQEKR